MSHKPASEGYLVAAANLEFSIQNYDDESLSPIGRSVLDFGFFGVSSIPPC